MKKINVFILMLCFAGICFAGSTSVNVAAKPTADWFKNGGTKDIGWRWMQEADALLSMGSNIGTGTIFYVDSGVTNAGDGSNWNNAVATIEEAYDLCTANAGDVILVAQGHSETLGTLVCDTEGVTIIGLGSGEDRPEIVFNGTADIITISGASNTLVNLSFRAGISAVVTGINITGDGDYTTIANCDFPEPATSTFEFITAIQLATAADNVTIKDCTYSHIAATGTTAFLDGGASVTTGLTVTGNWIQGEFSNAPIYSDQADTAVLIADNTISNQTTGQYAIEFTAAATGMCTDNRLYTDTATTTLDPGSLKCAENYNINAIDLSAVLVPPVPAIATVTAGSADDILKKLYYVADGTGNYPATVAQESALSYLMSKSASAAATSYNNTTDSLEAIRDIIDTINTADQIDIDAILGDTSAMDTAAELQALAGTNAIEHSISKDLASLASGANNLFAVTGGPIKITEIVTYVTGNIQGQSTLIGYNIDPTTPATDTAFGTDGTALEINGDVTGTLYTWDGVLAADLVEVTNGVAVAAGTDVSYGLIVPIGMIELTSSATSTGTLTVYMTYIPLSTSSVVTAQ